MDEQIDANSIPRFGPSYVTTADQRRERYLSRNPPPVNSQIEPVRESEGRSSNVHSSPGGAFHMIQSSGQWSINNNNNNVRPIHDLSDHNESLLDLGNDILEQLVTIDTNCNDGEHSLNPPINCLLGSSNDTQYRNISVLPTINNVRQSYVQTPHVVPYRYVSSGDHAHQLNQSTLNKTDRTVVMELIGRLGMVDGGDEFKLVQFLKDMLPVIGVSPDHNLEIIKLILPKVSGQIFKLWMQGVANKVSWDVLHQEILNTFIPPMRRREIESIELDRPQKVNETFSEYCENLISAGFALKTQLQETDVIDIVMNKCHPSNKIHFSFGNYPQNLNELRSLATKVTSALRAERRYYADNKTDNTFKTSSNQWGTGMRNVEARPTRTFHTQRPVVGRPTTQNVQCYRCRKQGHIAKYCTTDLNYK